MNTLTHEVYSLLGLSQMININKTIYRECIRYERLFHLTKIAFYGSNDNEMNIFINIQPIMKSLLRPDYLEFSSTVDLCSGILNIAAHYRGFFRSWFRTESKIYLVNSIGVPNHNLYEGYNSELLHRYNTSSKYTHEIINNNLNLLKTLIPYIPEVYYVEADCESAVTIYDLITNFSDDKPNLIISRDIYDRQLVGVCNKTVLYRPNGERSYHVCKNNLYKGIIHEYKLNQNKYDFSNINPKLLSLLFTLHKLDSRNIKMLYSFPNVKSIIDNALTNKVLLNNYNSLIDWSRIQDKVTPQELQSRFEVIDVIYQHNYYKNLLPTLYDFRDLYDPESVKAINNMYFTNNNQINVNAF